MKHLLRTSDLTPGDLEQLLRLARTFKQGAFARPNGGLAGKTVVCYFAKPSTRTRISFETAITRLGGIPISVGPTELQLGRGETIEDTARVLSRYAAAIVIRTFADDDVARLAAAASVPVINALTDGHHPCQSLADLLTIQERFGRLAGLKVAYVGDGNNVAHSLLEACALAGVDIAVATPVGYEPDPGVVGVAEELSQQSDSLVTVTHDPLKAVAGANAVYTDVWVSMGDAEDERAARVEALSPYRVDEALMAEAERDAIFLHCLPAHRGEEVTAEVIDGPTSLVWEQAANRLHAARGLLLWLLGVR